MAGWGDDGGPLIWEDGRDSRFLAETGLKRRCDEFYSGPRLEQAPDLILRPIEPTDTFLGLADFGHRETMAKVYRYSGMHRNEGMLIMNGPRVRPGAWIEGSSITDIAPTVLHTMGLPVPSDMDGRVLGGAFADEYLHTFPVAEVEAVPVGDISAATAYTEDGEMETVERLKGLGYME